MRRYVRPKEYAVMSDVKSKRLTFQVFKEVPFYKLKDKNDS